jgi:hypothetical protein
MCTDDDAELASNMQRAQEHPELEAVLRVLAFSLLHRLIKR